MTVADTGLAALQFPPLRQQVLEFHLVIAVVAISVLIQLHLYQVEVYSLLITVSSFVLSEIKTALRIALTVLFAVLFVV